MDVSMLLRAVANEALTLKSGVLGAEWLPQVLVLRLGMAFAH